MSARVTGTQAAQVAIAQLVYGWREQLSPREYAVLLDLLYRFVAAEHSRVMVSSRRWLR